MIVLRSGLNDCSEQPNDCYSHVTVLQPWLTWVCLLEGGRAHWQQLWYDGSQEMMCLWCFGFYFSEGGLRAEDRVVVLRLYLFKIDSSALEAYLSIPPPLICKSVLNVINMCFVCLSVPPSVRPSVSLLWCSCLFKGFPLVFCCNVCYINKVY